MKKFLVFFIRLNLLMFLFMVVDAHYSSRLFVLFTESVISFIIHFINVGFVWNGPGFLSSHGIVYIDWDCTGWKSMFFFTALVLSSSDNMRRIAKSFIFLPILYLFNVLRIVALMWWLSSGYPWFDMVHRAMFGYASVGMALGLWILWAWWTNDR